MSPAPLTSKTSRASVGCENSSRPSRLQNMMPCGPNVKVTIKIKTLGGRTVKVFRYAKKPINTALTARFVCKLAKRTYGFYVYATDAAGNTRTKVARNTLVVR